MEALPSHHNGVGKEMTTASTNAPPAFAWNEWYESVGGLSINIPEVQAEHFAIEALQRATLVFRFHTKPLHSRILRHSSKR